MRLTVDNLSRTIRTPVWCLIVVMVIIAVEVSSLSGPNVCIEKQKYNITKRVKYRAPMSVRTYVWCFAMPPRCSRWNTEMRDLTRLETEERTAEMVVCCPGYKMKDISCVPVCPHGKTGHECTEDCPPNKWGPSCVNDCKKCKNGICSPNTGECLCQDGWQGESCDIIIPTTTPTVPMMEQILTSVKTTASTKTTSLSTITPSTTISTVRSINIVGATSTLPTTTMVLPTKATVPNTTITSTTNTMDESKTTTTVSKPAIVYKNMTLSDISKIAAYNPVNNDKKTDVHLVKSIPFNQTKTKYTFKTVPNTSTTLSSESTTSNAATEHKMLLTTPTEIRTSTAVTTILTTVIPKTSPTTVKITTSELEKTTTRTETTRQPEVAVRQPTTIKFKPKEIWIRPAQKGESPIIESKIKANHDIPHSRSKTREVSTAATTPKTIVVSIIPTSVSYTSFKRIALTTALQTSPKINASIKPNITQSMDQSFTKPITIKTTTLTPYTIKVSSRKPNSSKSINTLFLQNLTRTKSYTSFSTKGTFKATTLPEAPTTNSMPDTWNANKKLNSSLLTTVSYPSTNTNPTTRKQTITSQLSTRSHRITTVKTDSTLGTVPTRTTTAYNSTNKQYVTVAQRNITMNSITTRVTEVPQVTKTLVRTQAATNVSKQNLTNTNAKTNTVTEDPTKGEETFHILTEPEHITAVMGDKEKDRPSVDLISVISIAGGVMMAIITVAVIIVMVERCKKPRYEDVRKYNDIRMQVMIDNNDVPPPPYVRSIFHTPLPEPPTSDKCHYQPISTLDRNLKQFMRPVVVQTISPLMLENFRGILECHYDHLPRRSHDLDNMQARCSVPPSVSEREELLPQRVHSLTDSDIEAMKCEAKQDVIDNTTSEPLYAEIPCWRPPSEHAIEVVNLNGEAVTEL